MKKMLLAALSLVLGVSAASADTFPSRPISLVLPFGPGGATDAISRAVADHMSTTLGQPVVIDYRAGAGGEIAASAVAKAAPDGYTIMFATVSQLVILPVTKSKLSFDPRKDLAPVGLVAKSPNLLLVSPRVEAKSLQELIAYAKNNPGKLNFASSGNGTITHLIGEMFNLQAGINAVHVPYRTGVQAFTELTEGQIHFAFDTIVWSLPQVQGGKLKSFGITSAERSPIAPELPTIAEQDLPGFEGVTWYAIMAPAGTPEPIMAKLTNALSAALSDPGVIERIKKFGAIASFGNAEQYNKFQQSEFAKWERIVKEGKIKVQ